MGAAVTRQFNGFLVQTEPAVGIPRAFFTDVLPQISELSEAQATLAVFRLVAPIARCAPPCVPTAAHGNQTSGSPPGSTLPPAAARYSASPPKGVMAAT